MTKSREEIEAEADRLLAMSDEEFTAYCGGPEAMQAEAAKAELIIAQALSKDARRRGRLH